MAKRTFVITFNDDILIDKTQERMQRDIYIGVEEYLIYTNNIKEEIKPEAADALLNMRVLEEKYKKRT